MNIMKTNMLSVDNKIAKEQKANLSANEVLSAVQPQLGMKALMFQGKQNLMANPMLAKGVGVMNDDAEPVNKEETAKSYVAPFSSNIAFKGGKAVKTLATVAAMTALAGMLASCEKKSEVEIPEINVVQNVEVKVDLTAVTALLANMQSMIAELIAQNKNSDAALLKQLQEMQKEIIALRTQQSADNAAIRALLTDLGDKIFIFNQDTNARFDENNAYQQIIISLLQQHMTRDEAIKYFNQFYTLIQEHKMTVAEAMAQIMDKLDLVNENLTNIRQTIIDASAKASEERTALYNVATQIRNNGYATIQQQQIMIAQNNALIGQNNIIINNQKVLAQKIDKAALSVNATINEVAKYLGIKVDDLAQIVVRTGKSLEKVMMMSKAEIVEAINANTAELEQTNYNLEQINNSVMNVDLSVQDNTGAIVDAANQILDVLSEISGKLDKISAQLAAQYRTFTAQLGALVAYSASTNWNTAMLNQKFSALLKEASALKTIAIEMKNSLENGVTINMDQLEEFFKILNMHQTESKNEIIAKLDEFIAGQDRIEAAINRLDVDNNAKLDYIACLVKNKSNDNADVINAINNLAKSNEENIAAATEELAAKLDKLIEKVDGIFNQINILGANQKQYVQQILDALDENGEKILAQLKANGNLLRDANGKLDLANLSLAQLQAEVEKVAPLLQKLNSSATTANNYLDIISKKQVEIDQHIQEIGDISGGGITAEELEAMWKQHDADAYAKATAYLDLLHVDNMDKADEIIGYLKKGNATAGDIYTELLNFKNKAGNDAEALRKLLQAVYDYLPELICKCQCGGDCGNNDNTHEGIIGIIS